MDSGKFYINRYQIITCSLHDFKRDAWLDPREVFETSFWGRRINTRTVYGNESFRERISTRDEFEIKYPNHKIIHGLCTEKPHVRLLLMGVNQSVYHHFESYIEAKEWVKLNIPKEMVTY